MIFMKNLESIPDDLFINSNLPPVKKSKGDIDKARAIKTGSSKENLVAVQSLLIPTDVFYNSELTLKREESSVYLRETVAEKLLNAQKALYPYGYSLIVLDGHRSLDFQKRLINFYGESVSEKGFVSSVSENETLVPPHTTGAAVDLTLVRHGRRLALGTDYDSFNELAAPEALEARDDMTRPRDLRRLLNKVLTTEDFVPHYLEWWHWSYGDQYWAVEKGRKTAIYGSIEL